MIPFYQFASDSPFLTFFLFWTTIWALVSIIRALCDLLEVLVRGYDPYETVEDEVVDGDASDKIEE